MRGKVIGEMIRGTYEEEENEKHENWECGPIRRKKIGWKMGKTSMGVEDV